MRNLEYKGFIIAMFVLSLVSCGSDSSKDEKAGSSANAQALEHYSGFINSVKGLKTDTEIVGTTYNSGQTGSGELNLVLDTNHTYQIYLKNNYNLNQNDDRPLLVAQDTWRIDGDVLVLRSFGRTQGNYNNVYNNNIYNNNNQVYSSTTCLRVVLESTKNISGSNGIFINLVSGSQMEFCKK